MHVRAQTGTPTLTPEPAPTATLTPGPTVTPVVTPSITTTATPEDRRIWVPLILREHPLLTISGIESADLSASADAIRAHGASWTRRNAAQWRDLEPTPGARNWAAYAALDAELAHASLLNLNTILILRSAPVFARKYPASSCGPVRDDQLPAYGRYVHDVVARYSAFPYKVRYFEIENEPDAPLHNGEAPYGCWGLVNETYRGGEQFVPALKTAYLAAKQADLSAVVLVGGMLANCDPVNPPAGMDCSWTRFFEGVLRAGGAPYFDGLSFHTYEYYYDAPGRWGNRNWDSDAATTGPVLHAKTAYFKALLARYGVRGKELFDTEVALLCWTCTVRSAYETDKAWYLAEVMAAGKAEGLSAVLWYSYEGWLGSGLAGTPALSALGASNRFIGTADYVGRISAAAVTGYKFTHAGQEIWLVRARSGAATLTLPTLPAAMFDALGAPLAPTLQLSLTAQPLYVIWQH